jgi:hypothetical protein
LEAGGRTGRLRKCCRDPFFRARASYLLFPAFARISSEDAKLSETGNDAEDEDGEGGDAQE